ncbi:MAG: hypothetical protein IT198_17300 [Acidimicrobiia bacterium]|nr:hypothetical protein [Acidimicrobiia bacterium]
MIPSSWEQWAERAERLVRTLLEVAVRIVQDWAVAIAILAAAAAVAGMVASIVLTRRALARRVTYVVVPAEDFAPTGDELRSHAAELMRARRRTGSILTRRASAIRISLASEPGGYLTYWRSGPRWADPILRIPGYAGVELIPLAEVDLDELLQRPHTAPTGEADAVT